MQEFVPEARNVDPLKDKSDGGTVSPPAVAIQVTMLACGGFVLAVRSAHSLADAHSLIYFIKDWARISRAVRQRSSLPPLNPVFDPERLDSRAAGNINGDVADEEILKRTESLPMNRYDWWAPSNSPWGNVKPAVFENEDTPPAGKAMPWCN